MINLIDAIHIVTIVISFLCFSCIVVLYLSAKRYMISYLSASNSMYIDMIKELRLDVEKLKRKKCLYQIINSILSAVVVLWGTLLMTSFVTNYMDSFMYGASGVCVLVASLVSLLINPIKEICKLKLSICLCKKALNECEVLLVNNSKNSSRIK